MEHYDEKDDYCIKVCIYEQDNIIQALLIE